MPGLEAKAEGEGLLADIREDAAVESRCFWQVITVFSHRTHFHHSFTGVKASPVPVSAGIKACSQFLSLFAILGLGKALRPEYYLSSDGVET